MEHDMIRLPVRPDDGNKGTFGCVSVAGGCETYPGAPLLCGKAAYRVGCGLVEMVVPEVVRNCGAGAFPEAIWNCAAFEAGTVPERRNGVTVIGPGLGTSAAAAERLPGLIRSAAAFSRVLVLDADALNLLARDPEWFRSLPENCVLTPHPGEMARLCGMEIAAVQSDREGLAENKAREWRQVILLKGAGTVVADPDGRKAVLSWATSALSKAGSGDVLSGIIAGFAAQGLPPFEAAVLGAEIHASAGSLAAEAFGNNYSVMAGDIINNIPGAISDYAKRQS